MLIRLIYASKASEPVKAHMIREILAKSRANNHINDLTGMLCHGEDRFLQILEGERATINQVYSRIMQDRRHQNLLLLAYDDVKERLYAGWDMDHVSADEPETAKIISAATGQPDFRPEKFSSLEAVQLTLALSKRVTPQIGLE